MSGNPLSFAFGRLEWQKPPGRTCRSKFSGDSFTNRTTCWLELGRKCFTKRSHGHMHISSKSLVAFHATDALEKNRIQHFLPTFTCRRHKLRTGRIPGTADWQDGILHLLSAAGRRQANH